MIRVERAHLNIAVGSHAGLSGKNNEDRYGVAAFQLEGDIPIPSVLGVVTDGIGGHRAGEVAAELAVEVISETVAQSDAVQPVQILQQAIVKASKAIAAAAQGDQAQRGMGTTCACAWVIGDRLYLAYVGDSRIYLIRGGRIFRLSTDHTWVQEAIEKGILERGQSQLHPNMHVIRRYLGSKQEVVPDIRLRLHPEESDLAAEQNQGMRLLPGDIVLLCTDGLTDLVSDEEILAVVNKFGYEAGVQELINTANRRGGHDNTTVVAMRVPSPQDRAARRATLSFGKRLGLACLVMILAFGIVSFSGVLWYLLRSEPVQGDLTPTPPRAPATLFPAAPGYNLGETPGLRLSPTEGLPSLTKTRMPQDAFSKTPLGTTPPTHFATLTPWATNTPQK